ncbi:MAG: hypothetical protein WCV92_04500 [Candidatus Buchananbacteria bacterium]
MTKEIRKQKKLSLYFFIERYFKIIAPVLFILVLVIGYFLVIGAQLKIYREYKNVSFSNAVEENKRLNDSKAYLKEAVKTSFLSPEEEKYLSVAVPGDFEFTSIVSQLTPLAQAYGFNVVSIEADKLKTANESNQPYNLRTIKISLNISGGDYNQFKSFLDGMEKSAMIFDIQSVSFGKNNSFQLEILGYYFK